MKKSTSLPLAILIVYFLVLPLNNIWSQSTPELEIYPGGIVFPRMTTVDRDALSPAIGQFIYNIDSKRLNYFNGTTWLDVNRGSLLSNTDGDTRIDVENTPDEDSILIYANDRIVMYIMADSIGRERIEIDNHFQNTFLGKGSGSVNTDGANNTFIGAEAGLFNTSGDRNSFVGCAAGFRNTIGSNNSFFGHESGILNTSGSGNAFFGDRSGQNNGEASGGSFFGSAAGTMNTTGPSNSFFGAFAGTDNTEGGNNAFFGRSAGGDNTIGSENSFFGSFSGADNITGDNNSFFGRKAGDNNTTGSNNTFLGDRAGLNHVTGSNNTLIGAQAAIEPMLDPINNAIAIGYGSEVGCDNCAVIGGMDTLKVNLGIGTNTPQSMLHLNDSTGADIKLLFSEGEVPGASLLYEGSAGSGGDNKMHILSEIGSTHNVMTWKLNGHVGINRSNPTSTLHVNGAGGDDPLRVQVNGATRLMIYENHSVSLGENTSLPGKVINVAGDYKVGIGDRTPDAALDVIGDILYTGSITDVSDIRLKENIHPIGQAINKIEKIQGITYNLIGEENRSAGLIAQEVASVLPEAVSDIGDGYLGVDYTQLVALLIEGMKEQQVQIENQQAQLIEQENEHQDLLRMLELQQSQITQLQSSFFLKSKDR